jgi:anti-anti-sigma regulatory factor
MVFDVLDNQCMQVVSIVSRVTVISFMASEIDRLESSTLQMLIDSIDQVVDVGYQFGLVCIHTDALRCDSYFV